MMSARWVGLWAFILCVLCGSRTATAEPKPGPALKSLGQRIACSRDPRVPSSFDVWAVLRSGKIVFDDPLFFRNLPADSVLHVFRPSDPVCRKAPSAPTSKAGVTSAIAPTPKIAPSIKVLPSAVDAEAARKRKQAEEREAKEREAKK